MVNTKYITFEELLNDILRQLKNENSIVNFDDFMFTVMEVTDVDLIKSCEDKLIGLGYMQMFALGDKKGFSKLLPAGKGFINKGGFKVDQFKGELHKEKKRLFIPMHHFAVNDKSDSKKLVKVPVDAKSLLLSDLKK